MHSRRSFLKDLTLGAAGTLLLPSLISGAFAGEKKPFFKISLAEWSLHRTLNGGKMTNLEFPEVAKKTYGIEAVEYVNQFFKDKALDYTYLRELNKRAEDNGVTNVLIMVDGEGSLAHVDEKSRHEAVRNHYKWVEAARFLGCHTIRVNTHGKGSPEEMAAAAVDSLGRLSEFAAQHKINVVVENHGGLSSNGKWLSGVLSQVNMENCGSLPDFGNFYDYDRYQGVEELMPFAKGVSAKTHDFDAEGNETKIDYERMLRIVKDAGYRGHVGIEYEGGNLSEHEGIIASKKLLDRLGKVV